MTGVQTCALPIYALALLLVFIGSKIFVADLLGLEKFPANLSLGITFGILAAGIGYSLWRSRNDAPMIGEETKKGHS